MREDRVKSRASGVTEEVSRVSLVILDELPSAVTCYEPTVWHTLALLAWKGLGIVCIGQFMILQLFSFTEGATLICTAVYCSEAVTSETCFHLLATIGAVSMLTNQCV